MGAFRSGWMAAAMVLAAGSAAAEAVSMRVDDLSTPTLCAEDDNVSIALTGPVRSFAIVAEHPRYMLPDMPDTTAPDFTDCDMSADPRFRYQPFSGTLFDDGRVMIVGHRYETDWRDRQVPVTVGDRTVIGLHLVQMFRYVDGKPVEFLVTYPSDGYWRAKPLPPHGREDTAYGTSFLIGPVGQQGRPVVDIASIAIDPAAGRYTLVFDDGSRGTLAVVQADRVRIELRVELERPVADGRPFATLRSMFVTAGNADAAKLGWLPATGAAWSDRDLEPGTRSSSGAVAMRLWRVWPSRHNTSSPEIALRDIATR